MNKSINKLIEKYTSGGRVSYDAPSHNAGGLRIDMMGNPSVDGNAEVEKKETARRLGLGPTYVFSDDLVNPSTGNTFAEDHKTLLSKYADKDDELSRRALLFGEEQLMASNDALRQQQDESPTEELQLGGWIPSFGTSAAIHNIGLQNQPQLDPFGQLSKSVPGGTEWYNEYIVTNPTQPVDMLPTSAPSQIPVDDSIPDLNQYISSVDTQAGGQGGGFFGNVLQSIGDDPGAAVKAAGAMGSLVSSIQQAEEEKPRVPNYAAGDALMSQAGERDSQSIQNELRGYFNAGKRIARDTSSNFQQMQSSVRQSAARLGQEAGKLKLQDDMYNDQMLIQRAGREDAKSTVAANEQIRVDIADAQNRAMRQDQVQNFINQMDAYGTEFQRQDYLKQQTANLNDVQKKQFYLDLLTMAIQFPDFTVDVAKASEIMTNPDNFTAEDMEQVIIKRD